MKAMKGAHNNGRDRKATAQARGHTDPLAYYRARASQPKPARAFDAEWRSLTPAERAGKSAGTGRVDDEIDRFVFPSNPPFFLPLFRDSPRDADLESAGLRVGEFIGWRTWRVSDDRQLYSSTRVTRWIPGEPMSGNAGTEEGAGIYAVKEPGEFLRAAVEDYSHDGRSSPWAIYGMRSVIVSWGALGTVLKVAECQPKWIATAIGTVRLYGTVIEHEHGYRAQYAMVDTIDRLLDDDPELLAELRARYC